MLLQKESPISHAYETLSHGEDYLVPALAYESCRGPLCTGAAVVRVKGVSLCLKHYGKLTDAVDRAGESLYGFRRDIVQVLAELE